MGTNYYARVIPSAEKKEKLKMMIDKDMFTEVHSMVSELYGERGEHKDGTIIHLGKRSCGWKFLWNPNVRKIYDGHRDKTNGRWIDEWRYDYVYPLTRQGISDFLHREDVFIFSEYYSSEDETHDQDDCPTADEFLDMALNWGQEDGWDAKSYYKDRPHEKVYESKERDMYWREIGYETNYGHDFYSDGLRFSTSLEFS